MTAYRQINALANMDLIPMTINLTDPIFHDEEVARQQLEAIPGQTARSARTAEWLTALRAFTVSRTEPACTSATLCRGHFTVTNGTVIDNGTSQHGSWGGV